MGDVKILKFKSVMSINEKTKILGVFNQGN